MPNGEPLYASDLNNAINSMYENKRYNKFLIYIEACYSGSMFKDILREDINVFAVTAANDHESSYAQYCGSQAIVGEKYMHTCLGDEFSVNWMEHTDSININTVSVGEQVDLVVEETTGSHVQQFGDIKIRDEMLNNYLGGNNYLAKFLKALKSTKKIENKRKGNKISNLNHRLYYLKEIAEMENSNDSYNAYMKELLLIKRSEKIFEDFRNKFSIKREESLNYSTKNVDFNCYKNVVNTYYNSCGFDSERDGKYLDIFAYYCSNYESSKAIIYLKDVCKKN
jgi:legumain